MLRRDEEVDFLAYSLPDAIVSSLAGINSMIVRSSLAAQRYAAEPLDTPEQRAGLKRRNRRIFYASCGHKNHRDVDLA